MNASYSNSFRSFQSRRSSSAVSNGAEPAEEDELLRPRDGGDRVHLQEAEPPDRVEHALRRAVEQLRAHGDPPGLLRRDDPRLHTSSRASSRSRSRTTRRITSSPITPCCRRSVHGHPLGVEQLAPQALVVLRALFDRAVAVGVVARAVALLPEAVEPAHPLGGVLAHPVLQRQLVEPLERRLGGPDPRLRLLVLGDAAVVEVEHADQRAERQALQDERGEDDAEGEEDDQLAVGKARAGVRRQRQRERGGERDRAAHPGPGDHGLRLPRRHRVVHPQPRG